MKIGYRLIDSPFKYHFSYLNDDLNYKPPPHISISIYGSVVGATTKTPCEIKTFIPITDGGTGEASFNFAFKAANVFDKIVTNSNQYILSDKTLIATYQTHDSNRQPVSPSDRFPDSSVPSGDVDHSAQGTDPDENPNHPIHFDGHGQN